jgi:hypothetical protein
MLVASMSIFFEASRRKLPSELVFFPRGYNTSHPQQNTLADFRPHLALGDNIRDRKAAARLKPKFRTLKKSGI